MLGSAKAKREGWSTLEESGGKRFKKEAQILDGAIGTPQNLPQILGRSAYRGNTYWTKWRQGGNPTMPETTMGPRRGLTKNSPLFFKRRDCLGGSGAHISKGRRGASYLVASPSRES